MHSSQVDFQREHSFWSVNIQLQKLTHTQTRLHVEQRRDFWEYASVHNVHNLFGAGILVQEAWLKSRFLNSLHVAFDKASLKRLNMNGRKDEPIHDAQ